jgi:AraC-type transcriptional regulator N-terminus
MLSPLKLQLELRLRHARATTNPYPTGIDGFYILRSDLPKQPTHRLFRPAFCITVQGAKWATFGDRRYEYGAGQAMVATVEMPSRGAVFEASPDKLRDLPSPVQGEYGDESAAIPKTTAPAGGAPLDARERIERRDRSNASGL